jgi:predicted porin
MKQKILMMTIAVALASPVAVQADVKFSGSIQGEGGGYRQGRWMNEDADYIRTSKDKDGALLNGGPNKLTFDFDQKVGNIVAQGRYQTTFSTAANSGLGGREAWVGLKAEDDSFNIRFGRLNGVYKSSKNYIDPFAETSLQARGTGGGMSGSTYNRIGVVKTDDTGRVLVDKNGAPIISSKPEPRRWVVDHYETINYDQNLLATVSDSTGDRGLAHSGYVNNALQIGGGVSGFSVTFQGVFDETEELDGAGLVEAKYIHGDPKNPDFVVFASGSYIDFGDFGTSVTSSFDNNEEEDDTKGSNWKVGAQYNLRLPDGRITIGLQYEDAEIGTPDHDINPDGGKYIMGSLEFKKGPVAVGGWVATYLSDIDEGRRFMVNNEWVDEDSISFAVGAKYFFSKSERTLLFGGYRQVDSDDDYRDEGVFGIGMHYSF